MSTLSYEQFFTKATNAMKDTDDMNKHRLLPIALRLLQTYLYATLFSDRVPIINYTTENKLP